MSSANEINDDAYRAEGLSHDCWRIVAASVRGPAHASRSALREDDFAIRIVHGAAIAVVCDGAGTASLARKGAEIFSAHVMQALVESLVDGATSLNEAFREVVISGVERARDQICADGALADYHTTLIAVVATKLRTLVAHVGDGLAGVSATGDWETAELSKPENGEFSNETYFVTCDNWLGHLRCREFPPLCSGGAAVVMTDGAMPFVVNSADNGLETDFMSPVTRFLLSESASSGSRALLGTLDSTNAKKISADDKTFVWIATDMGSL